MVANTLTDAEIRVLAFETESAFDLKPQQHIFDERAIAEFAKKLMEAAGLPMTFDSDGVVDVARAMVGGDGDIVFPVKDLLKFARSLIDHSVKATLAIPRPRGLTGLCYSFMDPERVTDQLAIWDEADELAAIVRTAAAVIDEHTDDLSEAAFAVVFLIRQAVVLADRVRDGMDRTGTDGEAA
ncbi:MAG: hypothetical protein AB7G13_22340 [Lautropia sp.]